MRPSRRSAAKSSTAIGRGRNGSCSLGPIETACSRARAAPAACSRATVAPAAWRRATVAPAACSRAALAPAACRRATVAPAALSRAADGGGQALLPWMRVSRVAGCPVRSPRRSASISRGAGRRFRSATSRAAAAVATIAPSIRGLVRATRPQSDDHDSQCSAATALVAVKRTDPQDARTGADRGSRPLQHALGRPAACAISFPARRQPSDRTLPPHSNGLSAAAGRVLGVDVGERIRELAEQIGVLRDAYYRGSPTVADAEYDAIEDELRTLIDANPELAPDRIRWSRWVRRRCCTHRSGTRGRCCLWRRRPARNRSRPSSAASPASR